MHHPRRGWLWLPPSTALSIVVPTSRRRRLALSLAGLLSLVAGTLWVLAPVASAASSAYTVTEEPVGGVLSSLAADPDTNVVYAATNDGIAVIDPTDGLVLTTISVPAGAVEPVVAVDPTSDIVYAIGYPSAGPTAYVISGQTLLAEATIQTTISLPSGLEAGSIAVDPSTDMVYVADDQNASIVVINGKTNTEAATIPLADPTLAPNPVIGAIAVDSATGTVYVTDNGDDQVAVIDEAINAVTGRIDLPAGSLPQGMAVDSAADLVYVADQGTGEVSAIDTTTDGVSTLASGLSQPQAVALGTGVPDALYVTGGVNSSASNLGTTYVIDPASETITDQIPRGGSSVATFVDDAYVDGSGASPIGGDLTVMTPSGAAANTMSPVLLQSGNYSFLVGQAVNLQLAASAAPAATFSATGLPTGLTLSTSGLLSGTPTSAGSYTVVVTAANGVAPSDSETSFTSVYEAPAVTSGPDGTLYVGVPSSLTIDAIGFPAPTFSETGALPTGVSFSTTGEFVGTPASGTVGSYPIEVTATNGYGTATLAFTLTVAQPTYIPVGPVRMLDTRNGTGGYSAPVGPGQTISLQVEGVDGVPASGVTAVVLNVTATDPTASSYVTVYPAGETRPTASNLNFTAGETIPNLVTVPLADGAVDGAIDFYNNSGNVNLVADLEGYYTTGATGGSTFVPLGPVRVLDTRNGTGGYSSPVGPGGTIILQVTGVDGVPATGVTAAVLNVTATDPTASSYVTVYPAGVRPTASNLNFTAGETIPNLVVVPVSSAGQVALYNNSGSVNLVADLAGYYTSGGAGSAFVPLGPVRVLDTRNGTGGYSAPVGPGGTIALQIEGVGGVPATGVTAVVLNVTATEPTASSYVTVYPAGETRPTASNLNFTAGETIPNLVVVPVGADGDIDFYNNSGSTDLVADLAGYFVGP
jgi:YVTN family beta-propeller protein